MDEAGRPIEVDGIEVRRDGRGRVTACGEWRYTYAGDHLAAIETPGGVRHLTHDGQGRPVRRRDERGAMALAYDADGGRLDVAPPPDAWNRDELGRLWTVRVRTARSSRPTCGTASPASAGSMARPVPRWRRSSRSTRRARRSGSSRARMSPGSRATPSGRRCSTTRAYRASSAARSTTAVSTSPLAHSIPRPARGPRPDPWDGLEADPRRADGFRGTLLVEQGPYTVCLGDPVGRVDHTGEASVGLILSTVTWSWQNNLLGWLSMDFLLNFWISLFGAIGDLSMWDRFSSFSRLSASDHVDAFAVRRDGIWLKNGGFRAWTYQHMVWAAKEHLDELSDVQVFLPGTPFEPTHYGSVIAVRPTDKPVIVLTGDDSSGGLRPGKTAADWTRGMSRDADGRSRARPLWDGSLASSFPSGPLHLDSPVAGTRGSIAASAAELFPSGAFGFGTIEPRALVAIAKTGLGLNPGDTVYLRQR